MMEAILYDKTGEVKLGNLAYILDDTCHVEEERNGMFDLTFEYPNSYPLADQLIEENFVEVKPNDDQESQKFRIYNTKKFIDDTINVFARHETFDLANDHVENIDLENASCEYALNTLFRNSHFSKDFRGYSDIVNAQDYKADNVNILNAIAGKEGSIIDTYGTGAEILRDGKNIHVLNKRGHDNGVTIEYGKNLTGFELTVDLEGLETRCGGFAKYKPEGSQDEVMVKSDWIDSPFIDNFSHPYISVEGRRDYSDKFKDGAIPTKEALNKLCQDEFKINKRDIPASNYKINFIPLSKCVGYEGIEDKISLCDTVTIIDPRFNVNTKAKVIKYKYDFIKERYISMELGKPRTTLGDIIGGSGGKGEQGPPGPPGKDGADGNIGDFPNSLPEVPMLTAVVKGFASIDLSWTYEDKVYYTYEVYASKTKDFAPNTFDLIHEGQTSSFLFQAKPNETWYFRVCAKNTHSERTDFSPQVTVSTKKADDFDEYFSSLAVGNLVTNMFSVDYMEAGIIKGHWIDAKNLSVTNGNGKRTFDIDSFGDVFIDSNNVKVRGESVSTIPYVDGIKTELATEINGFEEKITPDALKRVFSTEFYTKDSVDSQFTSKTEFEQNNREFLFKIEQTGRPQLIENGALRNDLKFWYAWQAQTMIELIGGLKYIRLDPQFELGVNSFGVRMPQFEIVAGKTYTVGCWVSGNIDIFNYNYLMQVKNGVPTGVQRINNVSFGNVVNEARRVSITFTALVSGLVEVMLGYEGEMNGKYFRVAEACCYEGPILYPYQEAGNTVYAGNAYIDRTGMGMKHDDGSVSRITSKSFELTDIYERLKMAMKKGTMYAYDVDNGHLLGMFGSNKLNISYKGITTGIAGSAHYYAIGASQELSDDSSLTMKPYILIAQQDLHNVFNKSFISAGVNFLNTPTIFHEPANFNSYIRTPSVAAPDKLLSFYYTLGTDFYDAFRVNGNVKRVEYFMPLDMHGWQIYNASLGYSVVNNGVPMSFKVASDPEVVGNIFDEIEVVNPSVKTFKSDMIIDSIGELDVTNVTNKDEIMLNKDSADLGKLVTVLFKEVKELKAEVKRLKEGV